MVWKGSSLTKQRKKGAKTLFKVECNDLINEMYRLQ